MEQVILTRQEFYNLIWSMPMRLIVQDYKISDVGLRKICKRMNIPLPDFGHWQKVKYHKQIRKKMLPEIFEVS